MTTTTTLTKMVDLALGAPENGAVNFNILNSLLHAMLEKLQIGDAQADVRNEDKGSEVMVGSGSGHMSVGELTSRVKELETRWQELNNMPTNSELFRRIKRLRDGADGDEGTAEEEGLSKPIQPVSDMWQFMQLTKQVETNTDGITKLMSMVEALFKDVDAMRSTMQKLISSFEKDSNTTAILPCPSPVRSLPKIKEPTPPPPPPPKVEKPPPKPKPCPSERKPPGGTCETQMRDVLAFLKMLEERVSTLEKQFDMLPDDEFFDSLPTWTKLEAYFKGLRDTLDQALDFAESADTTASRAEHKAGAAEMTAKFAKTAAEQAETQAKVAVARASLSLGGDTNLLGLGLPMAGGSGSFGGSGHEWKTRGESGVRLNREGSMTNFASFQNLNADGTSNSAPGTARDAPTGPGSSGLGAVAVSPSPSQHSAAGARPAPSDGSRSPRPDGGQSPRPDGGSTHRDGNNMSSNARIDDATPTGRGGSGRDLANASREGSGRDKNSSNSISNREVGSSGSQAHGHTGSGSHRGSGGAAGGSSGSAAGGGGGGTPPGGSNTGLGQRGSGTSRGSSGGGNKGTNQSNREGQPKGSNASLVEPKGSNASITSNKSSHRTASDKTISIPGGGEVSEKSSATQFDKMSKVSFGEKSATQSIPHDEDDDEDDTEGYKPPASTDPNRRTTKAPLAPATKGLKDLMEKLGGIITRHEALVKRVDALELWLRAELAKKLDASGGMMTDLLNMLNEFNSMKDEMMCIRAMFNKEAGSLVCAQEKMKQLQADVDCILKACYNTDSAPAAPVEPGAVPVVNVDPGSSTAIGSTQGPAGSSHTVGSSHGPAGSSHVVGSSNGPAGSSHMVGSSHAPSGSSHVVPTIGSTIGPTGSSQGMPVGSTHSVQSAKSLQCGPAEPPAPPNAPSNPCGRGRGKPDCESMQVRMSWCSMQDRLNMLYNDIEIIFKRTGGRNADPNQEPFVTMTEVQTALKPIYEELDDKVPYGLLSAISVGIGDIVSDVLQKMLDNDNEWRRVIGFLTGVVDSKLSREEMESFADQLEVKLRCLARRLSSLQHKIEGETGDAAAGTKKARCLSCDRVVKSQRPDGQLTNTSILPPGLPVTKSMKAYTTFEMEQFRQLARTFPSPLRPTESCDPFAVYRHSGGIMNKEAANKRVIPTSACMEKDLVECEKECVDGTPGQQSVSCCMPLDVQGSLDARRPCPCKNGAGGNSAPPPSPPGEPGTPLMGGSQHQQPQPTPTDTARSKPPTLAAPPPPAASSPCMVKTDLREFIVSQRNAISSILSLNPGRTSNAGERKPYKWPTKTLGSQVGGSLTKVTASDATTGHRACGSSYRLGKK